MTRNVQPLLVRGATLALLALPVLLAAGCSAILGVSDVPDVLDGAVVGDGSSGDGSIPDGAPGDGSTGRGKANGVACAANDECGSTHCVDTVCCESSCSGVCESCNLPGQPGACAAIPANTDPQTECLGVALADAGTPADAASEGGAIPANGDASSGKAPDLPDGASTPEAGVAADAGFNVPDGGVTADDNGCVGTCNGNRACAYPSASKGCGTNFCNTEKERGNFVCDGQGHCGLQLSKCELYTCAGQGCRTTCSAVKDCQDDAFCNNGVCQKQNGNGVSCTNDTQCASGACVSGICCSSACNFNGGTCTKPGSIGQCKCSTDCGAGSCTNYYRDADHDGYGNHASPTVGCSNQAPPSGYVADDTDCDDADGNVHPGQTSYFTNPSQGTGTYDYDCNGTFEKQTVEYVGAGCEFCGSSSCTKQATCTTANQQAGLACSGFIVRPPIVVGPVTPVEERATLEGTPLQMAVILPLCRPVQSGFTASVACGATGTLTTCGTCTSAGGGAMGTSSASQKQACH